MDPLSASPSLLHALSAQLNLDSDTQAAARSFYSEHAACTLIPDDKNYARCAILLASKTTKVKTLAGDSVPASYVSVTQLLRSPSAPRLQEFVPELLSFSERVSVEESIREEIRDLAYRYAFALKFFEKFEDLWASLNVSDRIDQIEMAPIVQELAWLLFLIARQQLLTDPSDVVENTNLLIAVIDIVGRLLPSSVSICGHSLDSLCSLVKTKAAFVQPALTRLEAFLTQLRQEKLLRCNSVDSLDGLLSSTHVHYNRQMLNLAYEKMLDPAAIDERDFVDNCQKAGTPIKQSRVLTPFAKQSERMPSGRVIQWDEAESQLGQTSEWQDLPAKTLKSTVATPVTLTMEMNNWLHDWVELVNMSGVLPESLCAALGSKESSIREAVEKLGREMARKFDEAGVGTVTKDLSFIEQHFSDLSGAMALMSQEYLFSNSKVDLVLKFCGVMLLKMMEKDAGGNNLTEERVKGVAACCIETTFFIHNVTALDFEEVLRLCDCRPIELWPSLTLFLDIDPRMPIPLKQHLRRIEAKIVNTLVWTEPDLPLHTPQLSEFLKRVLRQAAQRTHSLCDCLQLDEDTKAAVWKTLNFVIRDCSDLLRDRHLDQVLLCAVYACCKLRNQVNFKRINEVYARLNPEEAQNLTQRALIKPGIYDNIIAFYNRTFLPKTKSFLSQEHTAQGNPTSFSPLTDYISPQSYVTLGVPAAALHPRSPLTSPMLTPRTRLLYAHKETPIKTSDPARTHRAVILSMEDSDIAPAVPAHLMHILSPASSLPFELPQLKPDDKRSNVSL